MDKKLILLTSSFPYGNGEVFLKDELEILSSHFEEIIIVPKNPEGELNITPLNCKIWKYKNSSYHFSFIKFEFYKHLFQEFSELRKSKNPITIFKLKVVIKYLVNALRIKKEIKSILELNSDALLYSYWCDENAVAASLLKNKLTKVSRVHGWDLYFERHPEGYLPFRSLIKNSLDLIFPISEAGKRYLIEKWGVNSSKIVLSRLGTIQKYKNHKDKSSSETILVSCSSIIPLKRLDKIIETISLLKIKKVKWVHFGDGELRTEMEDLANKLLNIDFEFRGSVPNNEVLEFYAENYIDLFINLSDTEGIPVSIMEAMSFGIPVIATDVGGTSEIINNENGCLIHRDTSPTDIVNLITTYFMKSEIEIADMRKEAFKAWKDRYCAKKNYASFVKRLTKF